MLHWEKNKLLFGGKLQQKCSYSETWDKLLSRRSNCQVGPKLALKYL